MSIYRKFGGRWDKLDWEAKLRTPGGWNFVFQEIIFPEKKAKIFIPFGEWDYGTTLLIQFEEHIPKNFFNERYWVRANTKTKEVTFQKTKSHPP